MASMFKLISDLEGKKWSKITTSVRSTNRMNALLNASLQSGKKKPLIKEKKESIEIEEEAEEPPIRDFEYFGTNFNMEKVFKLMETSIEELFKWDRSSRMYDPWKSVQLAETLATEIKEKVKLLKYYRHRIVCFITVIEKKHQGVNCKMAHIMDPKMDNFSTYTYERASFFIVATVFLVYQD